MLCQVPGCKNKSIKAIKKNGIFLGVHLENVIIWTCKKHSKEEVYEAIQIVGEGLASCIQHEANPFIDVQKICTHQS